MFAVDLKYFLLKSGRVNGLVNELLLQTLSNHVFFSTCVSLKREICLPVTTRELLCEPKGVNTVINRKAREGEQKTKKENEANRKETMEKKVQTF